MCLQFTHRFTIEQPNRSATAGDDGLIDLTNDDNWTAYATMRGVLRPVSGREIFQEQQTDAIRSHTVEFWASSKTRQIGADYRLKYTDRDSVSHTLHVSAVIPSADGKFVTVSCLEDAA